MAKQEKETEWIEQVYANPFRLLTPAEAKAFADSWETEERIALWSFDHRFTSTAQVSR